MHPAYTVITNTDSSRQHKLPSSPVQKYADISNHVLRQLLPMEVYRLAEMAMQIKFP